MMSRERAAGLRGALGAEGIVVLCSLLSFAVPAQDVTENPPAWQDASAPRPAEPATDLPARAERMGNRGKLALGFEANQGQTDAQVRFLSRGVSYTLFLTDHEAVLALRKPAAVNDQPSGKRNSQFEKRNLKFEPRIPGPESRGVAVLRLKFIGPRSAPKVRGLEELPARSNYFIGNDPKRWRTSVANFAKVKYKDIYPGIDLVFYGREGQLEFDFVIAAGADPKSIRLGIAGEGPNDPADVREHHKGAPLRVDDNGALVVHTRGGDVRLHRPLAYQPTRSIQSRTPNPENRFLDARYVLRRSTVRGQQSEITDLKYEIGFEVTGYDPQKPLVIDPVLSYSTYLGGSGFDYGSGVAVDSAGNAYVTGYTNSIDFPLVSPAQATPAGGSCGTSPDTYSCFDAFVAKVNPTGSAIVYSTYFGGSGEDYGSKIAIDSLGNAYVTGYTNSTDLPSVNPAQSVQGGGICGLSPCFDAFVAKLNSTGTALVYSTYLGGSADDYGQGIAVDSDGNALVTGSTASADFPTVGAFESVHGGATYDAFVTKLGPTGSRLV